MNWDQTYGSLSLVANLAILLGIILVGIELKQNTEHLKLQLIDQTITRMTDDNRVLMGENPVIAIEKSVLEPENMTFADFKIVDAYLINGVNAWEDRFFLYQAELLEAKDPQRKVDEEVDWYFGNRFAKQWWRTSGASIVEEEFRQYVDKAIAGAEIGKTIEFWEKSRVVAPVSK